ncbi:hypothetical protein GOP47_0027348 [Adiantum capillus-veneris]|nr:hypothetical protein GOP47_0027348 [Adiantum capillus-veneris]
MEEEAGIQPDEVSFLFALKACTCIGNIWLGRLIHEKIMQGGFLLNGAIGEGIKQDQVILLSGVKACGRLKAVEDGRSIHHLLVEDGFESDIIVRNAVLDMYLRCGKLRDALEVHSNSTSRDVVTWNTAIAGSMLDFQDLSPTEIFGSMYRDCITPDLVTFTLLLKKYGSLGALEHGKQVFQQMCLRDLEKQGIQPNASTCTSILAICSHIGALEAGCLDEAKKLAAALPGVTDNQTSVPINLLWCDDITIISPCKLRWNSSFFYFSYQLWRFKALRPCSHIETDEKFLNCISIYSPKGPNARLHRIVKSKLHFQQVCPPEANHTHGCWCSSVIFCRLQAEQVLLDDIWQPLDDLFRSTGVAFQRTKHLKSAEKILVTAVRHMRASVF